MTGFQRIEVLVDAPLARTVERAAEAAGVTNWALLPTVAGMVDGRPWHADEISDADRRMLFLTVLRDDKAERLVDALKPILESHGLSLFLSPVAVVRPQRY